MPEISCFANTCPKHLKKLPRKVCGLGTPQKNPGGLQTKPGKCPWGLNSPKNQNCFWVYVKAQTDSEGFMPETPSPEIAKFLGYPHKDLPDIVLAAERRLACILAKENLDELGLTPDQ